MILDAPLTSAQIKELDGGDPLKNLAIDGEGVILLIEMLNDFLTSENDVQTEIS